MKRIACVISVLMLIVQAFAAEAPNTSTPPAIGDSSTPVNLSDVARELDTMKAALKAQQQKIEFLQQQLRERDQVAIPAERKDSTAFNSATSTALGTSALTKPQTTEPGLVLKANLPAESQNQSAALAIPAAGSAAAPAQAAMSSPAAQAPPKPEAIELAGGRIQLGFTVFGDWGMYFNSGFGPQFNTQINQPGPGNDSFNSFDISRTYINFRYTPTSGAYTLRLTPNIYRQLASETAVKFGAASAVGASGNGNLTLRMKYAYLDFNKPFAGSPAFGKGVITIGQQTNPLIDWEEGFYGYRFTSLVPWNYLSLSSTHAGVSVHGPIMVNQKQYLDYAVGVFDSGSFHNQEQAAEKQVMARMSFYPMGAKSKYGGLGFTGFADFGYANSAPDITNHSLYRVAAMAHYWTPHFALAAEYDYGKNAFSTGNLFSGSGPYDAFGLGVTQYAGLAATAKSVLSTGSQQQGFAVLGHVDIPSSPFSIFGLYQNFQPNTNVSSNPLDFSRVVAGIGYKYDSHLRFALNSQNLIFARHTAIPNDTNSLFLNVEVNY
jgi:hypothetical protein